MDFAAQREELVARLRERQDVPEPVAAAMLAVPRHVFLPGVDPEAAYRDEAIVTKRDSEGRPISSSSQPAIMAIMLGQLGVEPGHRVLEIGAGTGYNAALLECLAGPGGLVVSVDIDEDTVAQAGAHLVEAGFPQVELACRDGAGGYPDLAPYDRLIATVGVWDLSPAWLEQLRESGRLVVPLDLRGMQVSVALERAGTQHPAAEQPAPERADTNQAGTEQANAERTGAEQANAQQTAPEEAGSGWSGGLWVSRSVVACGFMRMRGPFAGPEVMTLLRREPELALMLPEPREVGDVAAAVDSPAVEVTVPLEAPASPFAVGAGVSLWLALHEPRWCGLAGSLGGGYGFTSGLVDGASIALLAMEDSVIARGHGPDGARLAEELAAHVRAWDEAGRPEAGDLRIEAHQGTPPDPGHGRVLIPKRHTTLVVGFD